MSKKIVLEISPDGNVKIQNAFGFGQSCEEATKALEEALGKTDDTSRTKTGEYFENLHEATLGQTL